MKLVVALLAAAVFASLICPASFKRWKERDGNCPAHSKCRTLTLEKKFPTEIKVCACVEWHCLKDKVYYGGVGCEGEDEICKGYGYYLDDQFANPEIAARHVRHGDCVLPVPPPTPTTTTTTTPAPKPTTKEAMTTTTSGTVETKYGAWTGMDLIGCFVFFFGGQL